MDGNLQKELTKMNKAVVKFSTYFQEFQEKNTISKDLCINLRALVQSIYEYVSRDLKLCDLEQEINFEKDDVSSISTGLSQSGHSTVTDFLEGAVNMTSESDYGHSDHEESFEGFSEDTTSYDTSDEESEENVEYRRDYVALSIKNLDASLQSQMLIPTKIGIDVNSSINDLQEILNIHGISLKMKTFTTCEVCQAHLQRNERTLKKHLELAHSLFGQNQISKHCKTAVNLIFYCKLCQVEIGYYDFITKHIRMRKHLNVIKSTFNNDPRTKFSHDQRFIMLQKTLAACKICQKQMQPYLVDLLFHIESQHKIDMLDNLDCLSTYYIEFEKTVYHCALCQEDIGQDKDHVAQHIFLDSAHLTRVIEDCATVIILPECITLFPFNEIDKLKSKNCGTFLLNQIIELQNSSPDDTQLFAKHHITDKSINVFHCGVCKIDVGKLRNARKHIVDLKHLFNLYKSGFGKQKITEKATSHALQIRKNLNQNKPQSSFNLFEDEGYHLVSTKVILMNFLKERIAHSEKLKHSGECELIASSLEDFLRQIYPNVKAFLLGPHVLGLGTFYRNVTIFIDTDSCYLRWPVDKSEEAKKKLELIRKHLSSVASSSWTHFKINYNTLQIHTGFKNHSCEYTLTFSNGLDHFKTRLIQYIFSLQPICRKLCTILIKITNDYRYNSCFNSYIIILMVIFYLQVNDYLPSVRLLQNSKKSSVKIGPWQADFTRIPKNELNLIQLKPNEFTDVLKGFLRFYTAFMDCNDEIICPYLGKRVQKTYLNPLPKEFESLQNLYKACKEQKIFNVRCPLFVQDPVELNCNVAEHVTPLRLKALLSCFEEILNSIKE